MSTAASWTEDGLEEAHPWIDWRSPSPIQIMDSETTGLGCKFCIAILGIKGSEVKDLPQTFAEFADHMTMVHGRAALPPARA